MIHIQPTTCIYVPGTFQILQIYCQQNFICTGYWLPPPPPNIRELQSTGGQYASYWNAFLLEICTCRLNIQYLFVYLFKSMSTKPHPSDHLYLFIYPNYLLSPCAVRMNINIYLFTYSNQCQQKQVQAITCICLFMQITCCLHVLIEWILISICLFLEIDVNKSLCSSLASSI